MATVKGFRDLLVWQQSMALAEDIYQFTSNFPKSEVYGLTSQLRRAIVSVPSNIAEGQGRNSTGEYIQFLGVAKGSLAEVETQLELANRLGWLNSAERGRLISRASEISRMFTGLISKLRSRSAPSP
jgi:four helix bundle protein